MGFKPAGKKRVNRSKNGGGGSRVLLVDSTDLQEWAHRVVARSTLPQLIRRLVHATLEQPPIHAQFPQGESVQLGGWDGLVQTQTGNRFVAAGESGWEMGCGKDPKGKADKDYDARKNDPKSKKTTFIFVTPRLWTKKADWVADKTAMGEFMAVRAYDALDLEEWLEQAPTVAAWLARMIGKRPPDVTDTDCFWEEWAGTTEPPLHPRMLTAGYTDAVASIRACLERSESAYVVAGEDRPHAIAFVAAVLLGEEEETVRFRSRAVVVHDKNAWRQLVETKFPLLLIPAFDDISSCAAARLKGHHVLIPVATASVAKSDTTLGRISTSVMREVLIEMGLSTDEAQSLSKDTGGRLSSLRNQLCAASLSLRAEWAHPNDGPRLVPALLLCEWNDSSEADRECVAKIAARAYSDVLETLVRWNATPHAPLELTGSRWKWVSLRDGWTQLNRYALAAQLKALGEVAEAVLLEADPKYELPPERQWLAQVHGKVREHSDNLRKGIARSLAAIGSGVAEGVEDAIQPSDRVAAWIAKWFRDSNSHDIWLTLEDSLPLLAEASPSAILDALENALDADEEGLCDVLFKETASGFSASSHHSSVLWALEKLAWCPDYLTRVTLLLGRLARRDPGGRLANRPSRTLRTIFLPWLPQTSAARANRIDAIDVLRDREPDVAWDLILSLIPQGMDNSMHTARPEYRRWFEGEPQPVLVPEYWAEITSILERLIQDVVKEPTRWPSLVSEADKIPEESRVALLDLLEEAGSSDELPEELRVAIWNALRKEVSRHRQFADAEWVMAPRFLARFDELLSIFEPVALIERHVWLFSNEPFRPNPIQDDWKAEEVAQSNDQVEAIRAIVDSDGNDGLVDLVKRADRPGTVGQASAATLDEDAAKEALFRASRMDSAWNRAFLGGFASAYRARNGWEWAEELLTGKYDARLSSFHLALMATSFPFETKTWDLVAKAGQSIDKSYWSLVAPWIVNENVHAAEKAVQRLLAAKRPYAALQVSGYWTEGDDSLSSDTASDLLNAVLRSNPKNESPLPNLASSAHNIENWLDKLQARAFDQEKLALLEFGFLPLFRDRQPPALAKEFLTKPSFFAEVVTIAYRDETKESDEEAAPLDEKANALAGAAYELLHKLRALPGLKDGGLVDAEELLSWVQAARKACSDAGRAQSGDRAIGKLLSHSPGGDDGVWPQQAVRGVIEKANSRALESSLGTQIFNNRGAWMKAIGEGGKEEKQIAARYAEWAKATASRWPRTSKVLNALSEKYTAIARGEDVRGREEDDSF